MTKVNNFRDKYARNNSTIEVLKSVLIVSEGTKTEPNYFESFKTFTSLEIDVEGTGEDTVRVVQRAIEKRKKREKEVKEDTEETLYDVVACLIDKDSFKKENYNKAVKLAKENDIELIYSNESFELWYLLHFDYFFTEIGRDAYIEKLNKYFQKYFNKDYQKNLKDTFTLLKDRQPLALKRARKLDEENIETNPFDRDPVTKVYELVELLNKQGNCRWNME